VINGPPGVPGVPGVGGAITITAPTSASGGAISNVFFFGFFFGFCLK
jgi:energy-converting hydrogenase Eha subunit B